MDTEYQKLLEKYLRLKEENEKLRSQLGIEPIEEGTESQSSETQIPSVNQFSSVEDKIKLFISLFAGRTDVYAKRWVSKRTGKSGYSPTCKNEWDDKLCQKGRIKCSDCTNRVYSELTDKQIYKHLSKNATESDVVGIYPMLKDETTNFVVIDFDDDYVDIFVDVLERMYFKRLKGYAELGYRVKDFVENNAEPGLIFDRNNFSKVFSQDLQFVRHEAVIVSPFLKKSRILQITTMLAQARADGVKITVVTRCPGDYNSDESKRIKENINLLQKCGINVVTQSMIHQKYAILDSKTVWYGSINLLSFGTSQETMMRLQNREIAETLLVEVDNMSNPKLY